MKRFFKALGLALALIMLLSMLTGPALAAAKVKTLQKGRWYTLPPQGGIDGLYRLKLGADSIVTVHWKGVSDWAGLRVLSRASYSHGLCDASIHTTRGSASIALARGTYYLAMEHVGPEDAPSAGMKITVKKPVNRANYSKGSAAALAAGKTVAIAQTLDHSYDRWYRIRLKKRQSVTVSTPLGYSNCVSLLTAGLRTVGVSRSDTRLKSKKSLAAGTYYLRVKPPKYFEPFNEFYLVGEDPLLGNYMTLRWK